MIPFRKEVRRPRSAAQLEDILMRQRGKRESVPARRPALPLILLALSVLLLLAGAALLLTRNRRPAGQEDPGAPAPSVPATAEPEPEPEPEPVLSPEETLLADMTLHEKVCQLFIVFPSALTGTSPVTAAGEALQQGLADYPVGGLILDRTNLTGRDQTAALLSGVQAFSTVPLLLTCDEEGGRVSRLSDTVGATSFKPMLRYRDQGVETAAENARTIASDMAALGFNMDLAPVADVWSNPANTVIGDRAYSTDFGQAAELVAAAVQGFHDGGVACVLKHFPGHGDTSADSHYGAVYVHKSLEELRQAELLPFLSGMDAGADAVMVGHLILDQVDDKPVLLSSTLVTDLLRRELGFDGVVMTDSLQMQAMTDHYGSGELAVGALRAGVDMLLCPEDLGESVSALEGAVLTGELSQERLDESVLRVLRLKGRYGMI